MFRVQVFQISFSGLRVLYEHRLAQLSTSSSMTGSAPSSCPPSTPLSPDVFIQQQQHVQSAALGVIRPTPTQPLKGPTLNSENKQQQELG